MVRDGILYGVGLLAAGVLLAWLTDPWFALPPLLLACFCMWFFRDPERRIPEEVGLVVSPADGKVTEIAPCPLQGEPHFRISIFLNVFDVHVNRSPIAGVIKTAEYRRGRFLNAMDATSAEANEQNIVTVIGDGQTVIFKQIAGLIARRIVFTKKIGDTVARGERVGLIKFGSRTDVILPATAQRVVKVGDRVRGGSSILARFPHAEPMPALAAAEEETEAVLAAL
jgi:phosphatidylserine decarboxylase